MISVFPFRKTRLAPTPSGYLHAGNALNFLLTAALAKQAGASLLLRVDDLDRQRYRQAYAADIFETLHFLNIQWTEGPQSLSELEERWTQQKRMALYSAALEKLKERNLVFACTCSRTGRNECRCHEKLLPLETPHANWRLITDDEAFFVKGMNGELTAATLPTEMKNFIVRKKDGFPAYQLSSVVDDLHFGIELIVRGEDLWPSTLAQVFLAKQLGEERFSSISFYHHSLLTTVGGEKLSKSAGASSVKHWRESGKTREEFFAYLSTLVGEASAKSAAGNNNIWRDWFRLYY